MKISIPEFCLVVLVGPACSGRSTFARRHFKPTEVISQDDCRGQVADGEDGYGAMEDASRLAYFIAETRLKRRKLAVIDAANVYKEDRARLVRLAKENNARPVAIVVDPGEDFCLARNIDRGGQLDPNDVRNQIRALQGAVKKLG